jgi:hypothetical protein
MGESSKKEAGKGCMGRIGLLFLIALFAGMIAAVYFVSQPQNLEELGGYRPVEGDPARDLVVVMEKSLEKGHSLALTETEINRWLSRTLSCRQGGFASRGVTLDGVWVRLMDGHAEIIQERTILGRRFTVSLFVSIERKMEAGRIHKQVHLHSGPFHKDVPRPVRGGRFGRLGVPQGFLIFVMPSFQRLAKEFTKEIKLGFEEMAVTRFEKRRLVLYPRDPETP